MQISTPGGSYQMAVSRSREYLADATGAKISGHPIALAHALKRLEEYNHRLPMRVNPATAQMYIVNPLAPGEPWPVFSASIPLSRSG